MKFGDLVSEEAWESLQKDLLILGQVHKKTKAQNGGATELCISLLVMIVLHNWSCIAIVCEAIAYKTLNVSWCLSLSRTCLVK